jgi:phosphoribosylamine--glycine ligase
MKLLVLGSGGREHALAWKLHESQQMEELYCAPGNAGIAQEAECLPVDMSQPKAILQVAKQVHADLTIVGPEAPLVAGVVDEFEKEGLAQQGCLPPGRKQKLLQRVHAAARNSLRPIQGCGKF